MAGSVAGFVAGDDFRAPAWTGGPAEARTVPTDQRRSSTPDSSRSRSNERKDRKEMKDFMAAMSANMNAVSANLNATKEQNAKDITNGMTKSLENIQSTLVTMNGRSDDIWQAMKDTQDRLATIGDGLIAMGDGLAVLRSDTQEAVQEMKNEIAAEKEKNDKKFAEFESRMLSLIAANNKNLNSNSNNTTSVPHSVGSNASRRSGSASAPGNDTFADERRRRTLVLSGFGRDTPRSLIMEFLEAHCAEKDIKYEGIFIPGKFASIAMVRFHSAEKRDEFMNKVRESEKLVFHDEGKDHTLYWNPDRTPDERALRRSLGKIKKFLITNNSRDGTNLFAAEDVVTEARRGNGTVWIKRDKVAEIRELKIVPLQQFTSKYGMKETDLSAFIAAEESRV